jgi:fimbrial chaperone protein
VRNIISAVIAAGLAAPLATGVATAAVFDVRPITLETTNGQVSVTVTNPGSRKIYIQAEVDAWSQDINGKEILKEDQNAVASPPAVWIRPNSSYTIRIMFPQATTPGEHAYRVLIEQLPEQSDIQSGRIVFSLTQNLPAFYQVGDKTPAKIHFEPATKALLVTNDGGSRERLADLFVNGRNVRPGLVGYVLAHSRVLMPLPSTPASGDTLQVSTLDGKKTFHVN